MNKAPTQDTLETPKRVCLIGSYDRNPFPLWRGLEQASDRIEYDGGNSLYLSLDDVETRLKEIQDFQPDATVVVTQRFQRIAELAKTVRQIPGKRGLWFNDLRVAHPCLKAIRKCYDQLFICHNSQQGQYDLNQWQDVTGSPATYMPQGAPVHSQLQYDEMYPSILFIGNTSNETYHTGRLDWINDLNSQVINETVRERRINVELNSPRLYQQYRYAMVHSPQVEGYNSLRLYNVLACQGLAVIRHFPGIKRLLSHGEHAIVARNLSELWDEINHYNEHHDLRDRIRDRGHQLFLKKHTVWHRVCNMVSCLVSEHQDFWGWLD